MPWLVILIALLLIGLTVGIIIALDVFELKIASSRSYLLSDESVTYAYDLHSLAV